MGTPIGRVLLGGVLLLGLALRLWGSVSDLPYVFGSDEPGNIDIIQRIVKTGDLNPHFFVYPSLFFYVHALSYIPYFLSGWMFGLFDEMTDLAAPITIVLGTTLAPSPGVVVLGRMVSVAFGTGAIALVYAVGRRLGGGVPQALLAAFLTAISPGMVAESRALTPDIQVVFWILVSLWAAVRVLQQGRTWHYVLAGLAAGCATGTKYNGAVILATLAAAHFMRTGWQGLTDRRLWLGLAAAPAAFVVTTPFALWEYTTFIRDLEFNASHYSTGHPGAEGDSFRWYISRLWQAQGLISVLALAQILRGAALRSRETCLLAVFPVAYLIFISSYVVRNDRTLLPVLPFLPLLAAGLIVDSLRGFRAHGPMSMRWVRFATGLVLVAMIAMRPLRTTVEEARLAARVDSRTTAREWIAANLPAGSRIAMESYSPFVDGQRFSLRPVVMMINRPPEWYVANDVDYLLFSQGMYRRFFREPVKYSREVALYDALFRRFPLIHLFADGGYEVRLHQVRTGAR